MAAKIDNSAWDASKAWAAGSASDNPEAFFRGICAGEKTTGKPDTQAHWALPHHYAPGDPPNAAGVRNSLSRLPQTDDLKNKSAAQKHLDGHMSVIQAAEKAASGRASRSEIAAARRSQREHGEFPSGHLRTKAFPGKLQARLVEHNGKPFYHIDGFATVFERAYPMWDMFGEYNEVIDYGALSKSLAANPDVAWLVNHRGVTMARTTNGTLELGVRATDDGYQGLYTDAYLNPDRQDVRDIVSAIVDGLVDEMSFAFMLNDGTWNDDYSEFRITEADINRGDVSAVNYGANPFTSIQARTSEILEDIKRLPAVALGRAREIITVRSADEYENAALSVAGDSRSRYVRAAKFWRDVSRSVGYDGVVDDLPELRALDISVTSSDDDPDDNAADLAKAVDANLDAAVALFKNVDAESLPPEVQQAIDLVNGAEANIDQLLQVMNLTDPDDTDETRTSSREYVKRRLEDLARPGENPNAEPSLVIPTRGTGKSLKLWKSLGNDERLRQISNL